MVRYAFANAPYNLMVENGAKSELTIPNPPPPDGRKQTQKMPPHLTLVPETYYPPHNIIPESPSD